MMTSKFSVMTSSSIFFDVALFFVSNLVTCPSLISLSLVLELWKLTFVRVWTEIQKTKTPPSEFFPISGDWGKLGIPDVAHMSLLKCYSFYCFWVIKGKPKGGGVKLPLLHTTPRLNKSQDLIRAKFN